jgi:hypothetical protein
VRKGSKSTVTPFPFSTLTLRSRETTIAYHKAKAAVLRAEAALGPLFLLLDEDSVAVTAANRAISMLGTAVGLLTEVPRDAQSFSDLYHLQAQIEWHAFNVALRRELPRAGRWSSRRRKRREFRKYEEWAQAKAEQRTHEVDGELRVLG